MARGGAISSGLTLRPTSVAWASLDLPEPNLETSLCQTPLGLPEAPRMWPQLACRLHLASLSRAFCLAWSLFQFLQTHLLFPADLLPLKLPQPRGSCLLCLVTRLPCRPQAITTS